MLLSAALVEGLILLGAFVLFAVGMAAVVLMFWLLGLYWRLVADG